MPLLRALYARFATLLHQVAKFGVIGVMGFAIDFAVFNALHHGEGVGPLTSNVVSTVVASAFTYVGNRYWSFHHGGERTPMRREIPLFTLLNAIGLAITEAFVAFGFYVLHQHSPAGTNAWKLIGTAVATVFRFATYKRFVFTGPVGTEADAALEREAVVQV